MDIFQTITAIADVIPVVSSIFGQKEAVVSTMNAVAIGQNNVHSAMADPFGVSGSFDLKIGAGIALVILFAPAITHIFSRIVSILCRFMVFLNHKVIDKIPVPWVREIFERYQVDMLKKAIRQFEATIKEIRSPKIDI